MDLIDVMIRLENGLTVSGRVERSVMDGITFRDPDDINHIIEDLPAGKPFSVVLPASIPLTIELSAVEK